MNAQPAQYLEIFLQPGDFYFGDADTRIRTILGSCVSITLWHPGLRVGGMCHYMLPSRGGRLGDALDGRYAEEAMQLFLRELRPFKAPPQAWEAKLFGGADMFPHIEKREASLVGQRNVAMGRALLNGYGFRVVAEHVGGVGHRRLIFDLWSGAVWLKQETDALRARAS
ncbi:MAG: chemotaxis protein CheD [Pseudomonadota bacterium]|uniref:chemotaxis protein CheD n=1 Tax=Thermithiobacillus tepidarius TaxID=929 RepID=UPI00040A22C6|nr:chemotaxis protein CheD [Thermithiobacillus tepidarius]